MKLIQHPVTTVLAVTLAAFLVTACGEDSAETAATPQEPGAPSAEFEEAETPQAPDGDLRYSGETDDGRPFTAQLGGDIDMPTNLPSDFPIFPGGVIHAAMQAGDTALVTIDYGEAGRAIYKYYIAELRKRGWGVQSQLNLGKTQALNADGDEHKVVIQIHTISTGSRLTLAFSPQV